MPEAVLGRSGRHADSLPVKLICGICGLLGENARKMDVQTLRSSHRGFDSGAKFGRKAAHVVAKTNIG